MDSCPNPLDLAASRRITDLDQIKMAVVRYDVGCVGQFLPSFKDSLEQERAYTMILNAILKGKKPSDFYANASVPVRAYVPNIAGMPIQGDSGKNYTVAGTVIDPTLERVDQANENFLRLVDHVRGNLSGFLRAMVEISATLGKGNQLGQLTRMQCVDDDMREEILV